jgi:alkanesulfonate monooxygenase SsuD/methylene tetrahydromethanopterin reductase-like flavin-dependent oxidoreductase (luciferase family)
MSAAIRFGLSGSLGGMEAAGPEVTAERAQLAEELGYDCMWFNEEHFGRTGSDETRAILSPIILAAAVAAATERLRVGFSVLLVPLHHPLRLAEELGTLDVLSAGRVNLGISNANSARYNPPFGYDRTTGPSLEQCLDAILGYWQGDPITVDGVDYTISPLPVQRPHPPIFVGAYRTETLEWAAARGYAAFQHGIQSPVSLDRCLRTYAAAGGDTARVPVGRFCYVDESDEAARTNAWDVVAQQANRLRQIGLWRRGDLIMGENDLEPERFYNETVFIGSPSTVAERIVELHDEYGTTYVNLLSSFFGLMPEPLLLRSLELFSREVMPTVERRVGERLLARIRPGMHLCSSDHHKWGEVEAVERSASPGIEGALVRGRLDGTRAPVYVPASAVREIRGGKCVVFDVPIADAAGQGWDRPPSFLSAAAAADRP